MKTGNVKQVSSFGKIVGICNDLGEKYNPSKETIKTTALSVLLAQAEQSAEVTNVARSAYTLSVNARQEVFARIPKLVARIVRAVSATEDSRQNILDVKTLKRRLTSSRKNQIPDPSPENTAETGNSKNKRSSSRLDFDGRIETFASLIQVISGMPAYNPNEADLKVSALKTLLAEMRALSEKVNNTEAVFSQARINRDKILYGPGGVHETGSAVKEYIRSVFGVRSDAARQLGQIRLTS